MSVFLISVVKINGNVKTVFVSNMYSKVQGINLLNICLPKNGLLKTTEWKTDIIPDDFVNICLSPVEGNHLVFT